MPARSTRPSPSTARSPTASTTKGAGAKAAAVYKKILKLKPDHEHTLVQISEILGSQGRYADARFHLNTLIELRKGKGDTRGALQAKIRLGSLDPEDYEGRLTAARARIEMGDKAGALGDLKEIAGELADKGRQPESIDVLHEAAALNPDDEETRERLMDVLLRRRRLREGSRVCDHRRAVPDDCGGARRRRPGRRGARHAAAGGRRSIRATPSCRRSSPGASSPEAISRRRRNS